MLVLLVCATVATTTSANDFQREAPEEQHLAESQPQGEFLEDAIGDWLTNFDTYTFMVKEDVDSGIGQNGSEDDDDIVTDEEEVAEEETTALEEDEEQPSYAPITVSLGDQGLLDPNIDYQVLVESLVAEEGSVFITLSNYANKSLCGVGGFSLDFSPDFSDGRSEGRLDIEHKVEDFNTTIIAFALESENNSSSRKGSSSWDEISKDFWWARGRLVGGGVLALTFTPPECGCLTLSTYYALPVGNMTLVVGPQAYPTELQTLMCVDPSARYQDQEEDEDIQAEENILVNGTLDIPQVEEQDIGLRDTTTSVQNEDENAHHPLNKPSRPKKWRKGRKMAKRLERKRKRQQQRQKIRQAGRRKIRQQLNQENRQGSRKGSHKKKRWNRKHGRKGKKFWKKFRKHALADMPQQNMQQLEHHYEPGNNTEGLLEEDLGDSNSTDPKGKDKKLVDILLGMIHSNNTYIEDNLDELEEGSISENNEVPDETEEGNAKSRRKHRRRRKKCKRKGRKNVYGPGVKFCCKQGIKHKKYMLILNSTAGQDSSQTSCSSVSDIVTTFANHQFAVAQNTCESTFSACCSIFTNDMWNDLKSKKTARKMQRKQRQRSRRQHRKQQRQERRQQRKKQKRKIH